MAVITKISEQKRRPNRRSIFLDGSFAFGCNINVVARFRLREGQSLSGQQVTQIQLGEVKQECFDSAIKLLQTRLHSTAEMRRKLMRKEWGGEVVAAVIEDLARLGYLNDENFARAKALSSAKHKQHGRRRAKLELMRAGVSGEVADRALGDVYCDANESTAVAKRLAMKQSARLKKLEPAVARRRLAGMLQRRGFDYDSIKPVIDEVLGGDAD